MAWSQNQANKPSELAPLMHTQNFTRKTAKLKYVGETSLTLRGNVSRKIYQFYAAQAVLEIEPEDLSSIASNPFLVRVL